MYCFVYVKITPRRGGELIIVNGSDPFLRRKNKMGLLES